MLWVLKETLPFPIGAPNRIKVRKSGHHTRSSPRMQGGHRLLDGIPRCLPCTPTAGPQSNVHTKLTHLKRTPLSIWAFSAALKILSAETQPTVEVQLNAEENYWFAPLAEGPPHVAGWLWWVQSSSLEREPAQS